jgi:type IV pilus assembly protein PilC
MAQMYQWVAETKKGRKLKGEIEAASEKIAQAQLKKRNLRILKLKPKPKDLFANISFMQPKVTNKDIVILPDSFRP